jgi:hypothetical protein
MRASSSLSSVADMLRWGCEEGWGCEQSSFTFFSRVCSPALSLSLVAAPSFPFLQRVDLRSLTTEKRCRNGPTVRRDASRRLSIHHQRPHHTGRPGHERIMMMLLCLFGTHDSSLTRNGTVL